MTMHINSRMHTISKCFRPTAPAGRTPRGPCSNTAPSSLRMVLNQPHISRFLQQHNLHQQRRSVMYSLRGHCYYFDLKCVLTFMINVVMKADLLNPNFTLKLQQLQQQWPFIASSMITSCLDPEVSKELWTTRNAVYLLFRKVESVAIN